MSADISSTRGVSAAETSEALSAAARPNLSADGELDLSIDGSYVAAAALSPPPAPERGRDRSRQGSDPLHHGFRVSVGRDGGEHEVSLRRRAHASPESGACHNAPASGWLVPPRRAEREGDTGGRTLRPGPGALRPA